MHAFSWLLWIRRLRLFLLSMRRPHHKQRHGSNNSSTLCPLGPRPEERPHGRYLRDHRPSQQLPLRSRNNRSRRPRLRDLRPPLSS